MGAPLQPFGNPRQDLLFWLKEYLSRKISTLSSRAASKEDAEDIAAIRKTIKRPETTIEEINTLTKQLVGKNFKSIRNYALPAIDFINFCIDDRQIGAILEISAALVQEDYFASRHFKSASTKKNQYRAVVGFINFIQKNNFINEDGSSFQFGMEPMPRSFESSKIPDTLLPDEFERFISFLDTDYAPKDLINTQRNRLMIKLTCFVGLRASELVGLTKRSFGSIDKDGYYPIRITGKGDKERIVYLSSEKVEPDLSQWLDRIDNDRTLIFPLTTTTLYLIVNGALKMCGIRKGKMGPHLLRHSYATYLLSKGKSLSLIQKLLGHSSIVTTTIYAKVIDGEIKDAAKVF